MSPKAFKALQAKWYKKLAQTGFDDIEDPRNPDGMLRSSSSRLAGHLKDDLIRGVDGDGCSYAFSPTAQYYEKRNAFLAVHKFRTKGDRYVYESSVSGLVPAEIFKAMRKSGKFKTWTYWRVRYSLDKSNRAFAQWAASAPEAQDAE